MVLRMLLSLAISWGMPVPSKAEGSPGSMGAAFEMGVAVAAAGAAFAPPAPSPRSARMIRPPGPVPVRPARSMPCASAKRRASGLALMRSPVSAFGAGTGWGAAGGVSPPPLAGGAGSGFAGGSGLGALPSPRSAGAESPSPARGEGEVASPSPVIRAIGVPTFTPSLPSATRIFAITPSSTASNSIVALSVSISASRSPDLTVSPSLTSHLASVPSSIVGDRAGILSSIGMGRPG